MQAFTSRPATTAPRAAASQLGSTFSLGTLSAMLKLHPQNIVRNAMPTKRMSFAFSFSKAANTRCSAIVGHSVGLQYLKDR
jgi:hypothetical protein